MKILLTILLFAISAFPCAPAQPIYGTAPQDATITLVFYQVVPVSPFGYYIFDPVLPCSSYTVLMQSRTQGKAAVIVEPEDFQGKGVEVNF